MGSEFPSVLVAFGINPEACEITSLGAGHVHDTYLIQRCGDGRPPLVLQKINHYVFKDVELLMRNLEIVTTHISDKNRQLGYNPACCGIVFLETDEGKSWTGNSDVGYWRLYWYIEDQVTYEIVPNADIAFEGGAAIASFQGMLADLDADLIGETIPGFHDLDSRIGQFQAAVETGDADRIKSAHSLVEQINKHKGVMLQVYEQSVLKGLPARITHNDAKFNNILFHKSSRKANCLIDLDTVMKGYAWFDFGDALRTAGSTAPEDESNLSEIDFRMDIFKGFAAGYLQRGKSFLTSDEISVLHLAPAVFAYTQSMRFLTDYMMNDCYYKTAHEEHNYQRALAQYTLMQRILEKEKEMEKIVAAAVK